MSDTQILAIEAIILIAVIMMLAGIFISQRNRKIKEPAQPKSAPSVTQNIVGAIGKTLTRDTASIAAPADAIVVLRDPVSSEWQVEVNGNRYTNLKDIHDDRAARKVLEALSGLQRFAGSIPAGIAPNPAPLAATNRSDSRPPAKPSANVLGDPRSPAPKDSILDQIENVLQRKLLRNPALVERHIHIGAESDGSLLIEVDQAVYKSADEVPDEAVRSVIKAAIQDWERA
jgi:hypothetical protein